MTPVPKQGWFFSIEFLKWYFSKYWQVQTRRVFAQTVTYWRSLSNEHHCHKAGSSRNETGFVVMCNIITVVVAFIECKRVNSSSLGHDSLQLVLINHLIITEININFFRGDEYWSIMKRIYGVCIF